jgi:hypothetical protein
MENELQPFRMVEHMGDLDGTLCEMARICRGEGLILISEVHPAMKRLGIQAQWAFSVKRRKYGTCAIFPRFLRGSLWGRV